MRFLLSGASGFVGTYLDTFLRASGHQTQHLVRHSTAQTGEFAWDPAHGKLDPAAFHGVDVVINLNGASIAGRRWTTDYKRELLASRVKPTSLLAETLAKIHNPPPLLISFSGAGYYGHHSALIEYTEEGLAGETFIAHLAERWEQAAELAREAGIWVLHPRLGVVIGNGGALEKMLPMFRLGLGARLGSGRQTFSWIALDDIGPALLHCIEHKLDGAVNFTVPQAVSNAQFTRALAKQLHRPAMLTAPAFALHLLLGEMADELLQGANVVPQRLVGTGFGFQFPELAGALAHYVPRMLEGR